MRIFAKGCPTILLSLGLLLALAACDSGGDSLQGQTPSSAVPTPMAFAAGPRTLPPILKAMPEKTVFALTLTDLDRFRTDVKKTVLYEAWQDPKMQAWRRDSLPKFTQALARETTLTLQDFDALLHGDAAVFVTYQLAAAQPAAAHMAIVLRTLAEHKARVEALLSQATANDPETVVKWGNEYAVVSDHAPLADQILANLQSGREALAGQSAYAVLQNNYRPDGFAHVWMNGSAALDAAKVAAGASPVPLPTDPASMLQMLGLDSLAAAYAGLAVHDKGILSEARVEFSGPRRGLFALIGSNAPSNAARLAPYDSQTFVSARHAGVGQILATIKSFVIGSKWMTQEEWQQTLAMFNLQLGFNLETDLPKMIGQELAVASTGQPGVPYVILVESPNPTLLFQTIEKMLASQQATPRPGTFEGVAYKSLKIPGMLAVEVYYAQIDNFAVFSPMLAVFQETIRAARNKRSLADHPDYRTAMAKVGQPGWFEGYMRAGKDTQDQIVSLMPSLLQSFNDAFELNLTPADMPDLRILFSRATPGACRVRATANALESQGYQTVGFAPDPLLMGTVAASVLGGAAAMASTPDAGPTAAPGGFGEAQLRGQVGRANTDMRSMATALESYYIDNNDIYPPFAMGPASVKRAPGLPSFTSALSTPLAYITEFPPDPFAPDSGTFLYWTVQPGKPDPSGRIAGGVGGRGWITVSAGPDRDYDFAGQWSAYRPDAVRPTAQLMNLTYDPTNGLKSNGDLWREKK